MSFYNIYFSPKKRRKTIMINFHRKYMENYEGQRVVAGEY